MTALTVRGRVEPFDRHAARAYAHDVADRERLGRTGIELIDPWRVR